MGVAQVGVAEREQDRAVVLPAGEIDVAHEPADQTRGIDAGAPVERFVEREAGERQTDAARAGVLDGEAERCAERVVR